MVIKLSIAYEISASTLYIGNPAKRTARAQMNSLVEVASETKKEGDSEGIKKPALINGGCQL